MSGRKRLATARKTPRLQTAGGPDSGREEDEDTPSSEERRQSLESTDSPAVDSSASSQSPSIQGGTYLERVHIFTAGLLRQQSAVRLQPPEPQAGPPTVEDQQQEEEEAASSPSAGDASSQGSKAGSGSQELSHPESSQGADSKAALSTPSPLLSTPSPLSIFGEQGTTKSQLSVGDSTIDYLAPVLHGDEIIVALEQEGEAGELLLPEPHGTQPAPTKLGSAVTSVIALSDDQNSGKTPNQAVSTQPETKRHFDFASKGVQENAPATVGTSMGPATVYVAELIPTSGPNERAQQTAQSSSIQTFSSLTLTRSSTSLGPSDPPLAVPVVITFGDGQPTMQVDTPSAIVCPPNCSDARHGHLVTSLGGPSDFGPRSPSQPGYMHITETLPVSGPSALPAPSVASYTQLTSVMPTETRTVLPIFASWDEAYAYVASRDSDVGSGNVPERQQSQISAEEARRQRQSQLPATATSGSLSPSGLYEQLHETLVQTIERPTTQHGVLAWQWQHQQDLPRASQQTPATSALPLAFEQFLPAVPSHWIRQVQQEGPAPRLRQLLQQGLAPRLHQPLQQRPTPRIHQRPRQGPGTRIHQLPQQGHRNRIHQLPQQGPRNRIHQLPQQGPTTRIQQLPQQGPTTRLHQLLQQGPLLRFYQLPQQGPTPRLHQQHLSSRPSPTIQQQLGASPLSHQQQLQVGQSPGIHQQPLRVEASPRIHQSSGFLQGPSQAGHSSQFLQTPQQTGPSPEFLQGPQEAGPSSAFLQGLQQRGPSLGFLQSPSLVGPTQSQEYSPQAGRSRAVHASLVYHPGQPKQSRPLSAPPPRTRATPPRKTQSRAMSAGDIGVEHHLPATPQASLLGVDTARYSPYSTAGRRHGHISSEASPERHATYSTTTVPRPPTPIQPWPHSVIQQGGKQHYMRRSASDSRLADFTHRARHYLPPDDVARKMEETYGFRSRGVHLSLPGSPLKEQLAGMNPRLLERVPGAVKLPEWDNYFMPGAGPTTDPTTGLGHHVEQRSSEETAYGNITGKMQTRHSWHGSGIPVRPTQETSVRGSLPPTDKPRTVQEQLPSDNRPVERATRLSASATSSHVTSEKLLLQEQEVSSTSTFIPTAGPSGVAHKRQMEGELFDYRQKMSKFEPAKMVRYDQHKMQGLGVSQQGGRVRAQPQRNREGRSGTPAYTHLESIPPTAEESNETEEEDS